MIINPAAFTHYSYAVRDACALLTAPLIEVEGEQESVGHGEAA